MLLRLECIRVYTFPVGPKQKVDWTWTHQDHILCLFTNLICLSPHYIIYIYSLIRGDNAILNISLWGYEYYLILTNGSQGDLKCLSKHLDRFVGPK